MATRKVYYVVKKKEAIDCFVVYIYCDGLSIGNARIRMQSPLFILFIYLFSPYFALYLVSVPCVSLGVAFLIIIALLG